MVISVWSRAVPPSVLCSALAEGGTFRQALTESVVQNGMCVGPYMVSASPLHHSHCCLAGATPFLIISSFGSLHSEDFTSLFDLHTTLRAALHYRARSTAVAEWRGSYRWLTRTPTMHPQWMRASGFRVATWALPPSASTGKSSTAPPPPTTSMSSDAR